MNYSNPIVIKRISEALYCFSVSSGEEILARVGYGFNEISSRLQMIAEISNPFKELVYNLKVLGIGTNTFDEVDWKTYNLALIISEKICEECSSKLIDKTGYAGKNNPYAN